MERRTSILEHVIVPSRGDLPQDLAKYLLSLDFPAADHERYAILAEKAQDGALTSEEKAELEDFLNVNDFLAIVQAKARVSLAQSSAA